MKSRYFVLLFSIIIFNTFYVSAQYFGGGWSYGFGIEQAIDSVITNLEPVFRLLLGGYGWNSYMLFEKLLLTMLVTSIAYLSLRNIGPFKEANQNIVRLVSVVVGVLGVRNLNDLWLNTIFIQYQVLFVFVGAFIPFLIVFGFLISLDSWARKIGWVFYVIVYIGLWASTDVPAHENIYAWTIACVAFYAFFLETPAINWMNKQKALQSNRDVILAKIADVNRQIADLERTPISAHFTQDDKDRLIAKLVKWRAKLASRM